MTLKVANIAGPLRAPAVFDGADIEVQDSECRTTAEVIDALKDADGALIGIWPLTDRQVLEACLKLKVVSRSGVGVDSVDIDAATELGICVCNTPGINTAEVADHAMALLLAITRRIPESAAAVKDGAWSDRSLAAPSGSSVSATSAGRSRRVCAPSDRSAFLPTIHTWRRHRPTCTACSSSSSTSCSKPLTS